MSLYYENIISSGPPFLSYAGWATSGAATTPVPLSSSPQHPRPGRSPFGASVPPDTPDGSSPLDLPTGMRRADSHNIAAFCARGPLHLHRRRPCIRRPLGAPRQRVSFEASPRGRSRAGRKGGAAIFLSSRGTSVALREGGAPACASARDKEPRGARRRKHRGGGMEAGTHAPPGRASAALGPLSVVRTQGPPPEEHDRRSVLDAGPAGLHDRAAGRRCARGRGR